MRFDQAPGVMDILMYHEVSLSAKISHEVPRSLGVTYHRRNGTRFHSVTHVMNALWSTIRYTEVP